MERARTGEDTAQDGGGILTSLETSQDGEWADLLAVAAEVGGELHHVLDEFARGCGARSGAPDLPRDAPQAVDEPPLCLLGPRRAGRRILRRQEGGAVDEVPAKPAARDLATV
jgi:hypothetical protein